MGFVYFILQIESTIYIYTCHHNVIDTHTLKLLSGPICYFSSNLIKLNKLWDPCCSFTGVNKYVFYLYEPQSSDLSMQLHWWLGMCQTTQIKNSLCDISSKFLTFKAKKNGLHFPDDIFKCIFVNKNVWIFNWVLFLRVQLMISKH